MEESLNINCPCNEEKKYNECCFRYHSGSENAPNAETLMRARYSAYALSNIDFLIKTIPLLQRKTFDRKSTKDWSSNSTWLGLEILSFKESHGGNKATVEFKAQYRVGDEEHVHHELSKFEKTHGRWFFVDGKLLET